MTSDKKNINLLVDIFIKKGLNEIVISPGSRNAPIILTFANRKEITALSIVDERSAAFFALGMAQVSGKAVAISCTSGSAALNYAPAIAEAYYQKIPLLILTADRPPELIENGDGQTIRQKNVYENYIKASFELPVDIDDPEVFKQTEELINKAVDLTTWPEPGPVHVNIPFREPLYNVVENGLIGNVIDFKKKPEAISENDLMDMAEIWNSCKKVMIIAGQGSRDNELNNLLRSLAQLKNTIILTETTSNFFSEDFVDCIDNVVSTIQEEDAGIYQPELIISFGGQVVSKMIKSFLRKNKALHHWHISASGEETDTYFCLSKTIRQDATTFFDHLTPLLKSEHADFSEKWLNLKEKVTEKKEEYLKKCSYSDLKVFELLFNKIPENSSIHLGNSTPVRYSQLFGSNDRFIYFSNRGVSGIDGQVSTAAGAAFVSDKLNFVITGDLGFFYDSNGLMNHNLGPNLKIIVINNGGGGIFRFIDGPASTPQLEKFFEAKHDWKCNKIAETFGLKYFEAENLKDLIEIFPLFCNSNDEKPVVLEIFTPAEQNAAVLHNYFRFLKS